MLKRKAAVVLSVGIVLTCSGVIYAMRLATKPLEYPIFLEPAGSPHHEDSERDVCAKWFGSPEKWWIAVEKDSPRYAEIHSAKGLQFELDIGSGLSDVCVSEEFDFKTRPDFVKAVVESCDRGGWHAKPNFERQVVLHLRERPHSSVAAQRCEAAGAHPLPKQIQFAQTRTDQTLRKPRKARGSLCKPPKYRG